MSLKVCVAGATGWAGSELARGIAAAGDLALVSAVLSTVLIRSRDFVATTPVPGAAG